MRIGLRTLPAVGARCFVFGGLLRKKQKISPVNARHTRRVRRGVHDALPAMIR